MNSDPFLHESWERAASEETEGASPEETSYATFETARQSVESNQELKEMFKDVESSILRYGESVTRFDRGQLEGITRKDMENIDGARRSAHDSMIDQINALSRACAQAGLDNQWRNMVGSDRIQIGEWALKVGAILKNSILEGNGLEQ